MKKKSKNLQRMTLKKDDIINIVYQNYLELVREGVKDTMPLFKKVKFIIEIFLNVIQTESIYSDIKIVRFAKFVVDVAGPREILKPTVNSNGIKEKIMLSKRAIVKIKPAQIWKNLVQKSLELNEEKTPEPKKKK